VEALQHKNTAVAMIALAGKRGGEVINCPDHSRMKFLLRFEVTQKAHGGIDVLTRLVLQWVIVLNAFLAHIDHNGSPVTPPFVERKAQESAFQEDGDEPSPNFRVIVLDKLTCGLFCAAQLIHKRSLILPLEPGALSFDNITAEPPAR
jgi:hypothetical protein